VSTLELRLLLWALVPLVFFSVSVGKQPRYILPVLPPLAILLAVSILERTRDWRSLDGARVRLLRPRSIMLASLIAGAGFVLLAMLLWRAAPLLINVSTWLTLGAAVVIASCGVGVTSVGLSRAWRSTPAALAVGAALVFAALQYGALSASGDDTVEQVARAVMEARSGQEAVGTYHVFVRNLVFYTNYTKTPTEDLITDEQVGNFLRRGERVLLVAPADALEPLERRLGLTLHRLAAIPYFNVAGIRLRTLLVPDPARDITRVVVVANR
jgi:4-amino-4-deoxy-L-arabinose transferase-like glycosyltransferase